MASKNLTTQTQAYAQYRLNNLSKFVNAQYLFFANHYKELDYSMPTVDSSIASKQAKKNRRKWNTIIKQQEALENRVLAQVGAAAGIRSSEPAVILQALNDKIETYRKDALKKEAITEQKMSQTMSKMIDNAIDNFAYSADFSIDEPIQNFIDKELYNSQNILTNQLQELSDLVDNPEALETKVARNLLEKINSYQALAEGDVNNAQVRAREKGNILKKKYSTKKMYDSIKASISGTLNSLNNAFDETTMINFLNSLNFGINATQPSGNSLNKKVKADIHFTLPSIKDNDFEKKLSVGILDKVNGQRSIQLHSAGNIDSLVKWMSQYKGTSSAIKILKSNEFRFALANEINAGSVTQSQAWKIFSDIIRSTIFIWIGNEFMLDKRKATSKFFGSTDGNFNIALIADDGKLSRVSTIYKHMKLGDMDRYATLSKSAGSGGGTTLSMKKEVIKQLPKLSREQIPSEAYPNNLMATGYAATQQLLDRVTYSISLNKNLF